MHRKAGRLQGPDEGSRAQLFHNHHKSKNTFKLPHYKNLSATNMSFPFAPSCDKPT